MDPDNDPIYNKVIYPSTSLDIRDLEISGDKSKTGFKKKLYVIIVHGQNVAIPSNGHHWLHWPIPWAPPLDSWRSQSLAKR